MEVFRKFTRAKWSKFEEPHPPIWRNIVFDNKFDTWPTKIVANCFHRKIQFFPNFQADVLGADIKTSSNKLSVWSTDGLTDFEIKCIAGGMMSSLEKYYIIKFDLDDSLFSFIQSNGKTGYTLNRDKHYDVTNLNDTKMHKIAKVMQDAIQCTPERIIDVSKPEFKKILKENKQNFAVADFPKASSSELIDYINRQ